MKQETKTIRRGGALSAAAFLALALLSSGAAAAPQACGCDRRQGLSWSEHLNYWSNMVAIVRDVDDRYTDLERARSAAQEEWAKAGEALERAVEIKDRARNLRLKGSDLKRDFSSNRDTPAGLVGLGPVFGTFLDGWNEAVADQRALYGGGGWEAALRKGDKAREDFERTAKRFLSAYQKAENLRYGAGGDLDCVKRLFDETDRKRETADSWAADLQTDKQGASENRQKLTDIKSEIDSCFNDLSGYVQTIAETFGLPSTATPEQISAEIADRTVERVTVRFGNVKRPVEPQILRKGIDKPERVEPDGDPNGPGFLGWRERSNKRPFENWDVPVSEDLTLDATWGYTVWVGGEKIVFPSSDWGDRYTLSAIFTDKKVEVVRDELARKPPKGKVFDGWASDERPDELLRNATAPAVDGLRLVPHYADVSYTLTFVVPEGKAPPPQTLGYKEIPRVPDLAKLESVNGFRYVRWVGPDGRSWNGGAALTNDLVVTAVPEADYKLRFHDDKRAFLSVVPVRASEPFSLQRAPTPPERRRKTFAGWIDGQGRPFQGGLVKDDANLYASYRDETTSEFIRRIYKPLEDRFPLEGVVGADIALVVLLGVLGVTGRKSRPKKRKKAEEPPPENPPPVGGEEGPQDAS